MSNHPMPAPAIKSPGALLLTKEAALKVIHSVTSTPAQHEEAIANLTAIARQELIRSAA